MAGGNTSVENEGFFLTTALFKSLLEEVGFSLQSPHMHYFYEKEVIAAFHKGWHYLHWQISLQDHFLAN